MNQRYNAADTALSERFPLYTRANVGEVFPDPVTPLTSGSLMFMSETGWREAWRRMGAFQLDEFPAEEFCQLGIVGGYCYLNASLIRLFGERAPGLTWKDMDEQFFGAQPGIPPYVEQPGDIDLDATVKIGETFGWALSQILAPVVEYRVCPTAICPWRELRVASSKTWDTNPMSLKTIMWRPSDTAMPADSWPRCCRA